jgi:membrane protein YqaA with SNARE-associated domain
MMDGIVTVKTRLSWGKRFINWSVTNSDSKALKIILFFLAFIDGFAFPVPTSTIFMALALVSPRNTYRYAIINIAGIVAGSIAGYYLGFSAWLKPDGQMTGMAHFIVNNIPGLSVSGFESAKRMFDTWNFGILIAGAFTPVPYGVYSIVSGIFHFSFPLFCISALLSNGAKFFLQGFAARKSANLLSLLISRKPKPAAIIAFAGLAAATVLIIIII